MSEPPVRPLQIAVCGPSDATADELAVAADLGRLVAERGATLVCGGLGGAMAAACRGAKERGGTTIGVLPGYDARAANPWVDHVVCTGMGQARNVVLVASADAVIAAGGGFGTLSEAALALRLGRPVVLLNGWDAVLTYGAVLPVPISQGTQPLAAMTAAEAVDLAIAAVRGSR